MALTPAPLLVVSGTLHDVQDVKVAARAAEPEVRDEETGALVRKAVEGREEYTVTEAVVLTDGGGFATITFKPEDYAAVGAPAKGEHVGWRVRAWVRWFRGRRGAYSAVAYVYDSMPEVSSGRRGAPVAAAA